MKRKIAIFIFLAMALGVMAASANFDMDAFLKEYRNLSGEVKTPKLDMWRPTVWNKMRVLVIAPSWGQRESVELRERFDFDVTTLMTLRHNAFSGLTAIGSPLSPENVEEQFDEKLKEDYDVIVMALTKWELYPSEYRYEILRKVYEDGAGLVLVRVEKHKELDQLFKREKWNHGFTLPVTSPLTVFSKGRESRLLLPGVVFGKGRVMRLDWNSIPAQMIFTPWISACDHSWEYEHNLSLTARAIVAASGRNAAIADQKLLNDVIVPREGRAKIDLSVSGLESGKVEIFAFNGNVPGGKSLGNAQISGGRASVALAANGIPEGRYHLLAQFRDGEGRLAGWQGGSVSIQSPTRIAGVEFDRYAIAGAGQPVSGRIALEGVPAGTPLEIEVQDMDGRLVHRQSFPATEKTTAFMFPAPAPLNSCMFKMQVSLPGNAARAVAEFTVQGKERPAFSFGAWTESQQCYMSGLFYRSMLENAGMDGIFYSITRGDAAVAAPLIMRNKMMGIPMYPHYNHARDKRATGVPKVKNRIWDEKFLAERADNMRKIAGIWSKYDVHSYTDGSDKSRGGNSFDEESIKYFRSVWLPGRYKDVAAMNAALGTTLSSFDEAAPKHLEEARKNPADLPMWLEFNRFHEQKFVEYFRMMVKIGREIDLNGECYLGPDGFGRLDPFEFCGFYDLLRSVTYFNLYTYQDPPQMEIARSLLKYAPDVRYRTIYAGTYGGQYMQYSFMRRIPWYMLLHDYNGFFWYMATGKNSFSSEGCMGFMPDLRPSEALMISADQIAEIRRGLAHIVGGSRRENNGIAVLYDHTSVSAATVDKQENALRQSYAVLQYLLEDMGLQYDYIPSERLDREGLEGYRVLFLPGIRCLSSEDWKAMEEFVQNGGLVVADILPGKYDRFLKNGGQESRQEYFKGRAGWLLKEWSSYGMLRSRNISKAAAASAEWKALLDKYVHDDFPFAGDFATGCEKVVYRLQEGGSMVFIMNSSDETRKVSFRVQGRRFAECAVYDMRAHRTLESASGAFECELKSGETAAYAVLEQKAPEFSLTVGAVEACPGQSVAYTLNSAHPIMTAAQFQVYDPSGKLRSEYTRTRLISQSFVLPLALDDPAGTWKIVATEAITGRRLEAVLQVR